MFVGLRGHVAGWLWGLGQIRDWPSLARGSREEPPNQPIARAGVVVVRTLATVRDCPWVKFWRHPHKR
jgi:hypothetical protein